MWGDKPPFNEGWRPTFALCPPNRVRDRDIFLRRLRGESCVSIGKRHGLTNSRASQISEKIKSYLVETLGARDILSGPVSGDAAFYGYGISIEYRAGEKYPRLVAENSDAGND